MDTRTAERIRTALSSLHNQFSIQFYTTLSRNSIEEKLNEAIVQNIHRYSRKWFNLCFREYPFILFYFIKKRPSTTFLNRHSYLCERMKLFESVVDKALSKSYTNPVTLLYETEQALRRADPKNSVVNITKQIIFELKCNPHFNRLDLLKSKKPLKKDELVEIIFLDTEAERNYYFRTTIQAKRVQLLKLTESQQLHLYNIMLLMQRPVVEKSGKLHTKSPPYPDRPKHFGNKDNRLRDALKGVIPYRLDGYPIEWKKQEKRYYLNGIVFYHITECLKQEYTKVCFDDDRFEHTEQYETADQYGQTRENIE